MELVITVLSVFMILQLGSGMIPPRPNLSNSYSAELTDLNAGTELKFVNYVNYEEQKVLQIADLGSPGAGTGQVQTIVLGKSSMLYNYFVAFDFCAAEPVGITILPLWSWLRNATFKGTQEFMGKQVDVWMYKNKTDDTTSEAGFLTADPETPIYLLDSNGLPVLFSNYSNSAPPESKFALPEACKHAVPQERPPNHGGSDFFMSALFKHTYMKA